MGFGVSPQSKLSQRLINEHAEAGVMEVPAFSVLLVHIHHYVSPDCRTTGYSLSRGYALG